MAEFRTGVPRREGNTGTLGTSATSVFPTFDSFGEIEPYSKFIADRKKLNERYDNQVYEERTGTVIKRWGYPDEQQFEQAVKAFLGSDEINEWTRQYYSTAGTGGLTPPITPDWECCDFLRINAPGTVKSGSTTPINAGNKKGCVYYWSIEGCNPSYWGCGSIAAAGTGGSGAGLHQTSKGVVFVAPTIPDAKTVNCGRTVDTKIKVAILTADGQKQAAAAVGTAGWSGYGLGPGDELYDLFGPDNVCDDTATITTVADDCNEGDCANVRIGFVSNTMGTNEYQGLVALNATADMDIRWENTGGGNLSGRGVNVVYGSPGSNWNCEENGYIKLFCNNQLVDSLKISTTIFIHTYPAYSQFKDLCDADIPAGQPDTPSCPAVVNGIAQPESICDNGFCYSKCCNSIYLCDGTLSQRGHTTYSWSWGTQPGWCVYPHPDPCYLYGDGYIKDLRGLYYSEGEPCCPPNL